MHACMHQGHAGTHSCRNAAAACNERWMAGGGMGGPMGADQIQDNQDLACTSVLLAVDPTTNTARVLARDGRMGRASRGGLAQGARPGL